MPQLMHHMSPAMIKLIEIIALAIAGNCEAREKIERFDEHLQKILGPFNEDSFIEGAEVFVTSLD